MADAEREERAVQAVRLWLDSLHDVIAITCDESWGEKTASASIPEWVRTATRRLDRTLFAPVTTTLDVLELTPYRAGFALGMLQWSLQAIEVKPTEEVRRLIRRQRFTPRTKRRVSRLFEDFLIRGGFVTRAEYRRSKFIPTRAEKYVSTLSNKPLRELAEFHRGISDGLRGLGRDNPQDRSDLATDILFTLAIWWRVVAKMKSVTELHAWLVRLLGIQQVGEKKRVEKICERIGLTLRPPGRPRENSDTEVFG